MKLTIIKTDAVVVIDPITRPTVWKLYNVPPDARVAISAILPKGGVVTHADVTYVVGESGEETDAVRTAPEQQ